MRPIMLLLPVLLLVLGGCANGFSLCSDPCQGIAASDCRQCFESRKVLGIETNPNAGCGEPVYAGTHCLPTAPALAVEKKLDELFGCPPSVSEPLAIPFGARPLGVNPCAPPMAMATSNDKNCGPLPPEAKPGEVWCCVFVQPPAAAPQRVCVAPASQRCIPVPAVMGTRTRQVLVAPATTKWEQVDCGPGSTQQVCYRLVEVPAQYRTETYQVVEQPASVRYEQIPAKYEMRMSAPPPGYWEWQRKTDCEVPAAVAPAPVALDEPPAGS